MARGLVLPRLETPGAARARSLGPEAIDWVNQSGVLGQGRSLLPWQQYVFRRALELTPGRGARLRWRTVVVTVARQQGKSVGVRGLAWWRMHQWERFGEDQLVLHVAQQIDAAVEVWTPAAYHALDVYGRKAVRNGRGSEEIVLPDRVGRWKLASSKGAAGVGYSTSMVIADEAWAIDKSTVDDRLVPTMAARNQPQLWLISTAGDHTSDLLLSYREAALMDPDGDVLLLEWSPPEDAPYDDPLTWRWASPNWTPEREKVMRSALAASTEQTFNRQWNNRWVDAAQGWIPRTVWEKGHADVEPDGPAHAVAVEQSMDGSRWGAVAAWTVGDGAVWVEGWVGASPASMWAWVEARAPRRLLLPPGVLLAYQRRGRPVEVTNTVLARQVPTVTRLIEDAKLLHAPTDHALTGDVLKAVAHPVEGGVALPHKDGREIQAARAMVWAVGDLLRPAQPRPVIRAV